MRYSEQGLAFLWAQWYMLWYHLLMSDIVDLVRLYLLVYWTKGLSVFCHRGTMALFRWSIILTVSDSLLPLWTFIICFFLLPLGLVCSCSSKTLRLDYTFSYFFLKVGTSERNLFPVSYRYFHAVSTFSFHSGILRPVLPMSLALIARRTLFNRCGVLWCWILILLRSDKGFYSIYFDLQFMA